MDSSQAGTPASPPKGRGTDSNHKTWRSNWWQFYPILERPRRPLVWSQSSVIWTAHSTQPIITGRHFSSSKQFVLPSPPLVISLPASFEPPTVISVSSNDEWLFAFYPRKDGEGVGSIWKRGAQIDNWQVRDNWTFPKCGGAVAASWLAGPREWVSTLSGTPTRLPYRGPPTPASNPTLVLVTEDLAICFFYYRYTMPRLRGVKRSLSMAGRTSEGPASDGLVGVNGMKHCVDATIGIGYNENAILVATHSRRMPAPLVMPHDATDVSPIDLAVPRKHDSETWGEEFIVEVYEVQLEFDGTILGLSHFPCGTLNIGDASLVKMSFHCAPPTSQDQTIPKAAGDGHSYLAVSTVDFHSYATPPTSNLNLYSLVKIGTSPATKVYPQASISISNGVFAHLESFVDFSSMSGILLQAYVLYHFGFLAAGNSKAKDLPIGTVKVLNIPDLSEHAEFRPTTVNYPWDSVGLDLPAFASVSPHHRLMCTLSTSLWKTQVLIYPLPKKNAELNVSPPLSSQFACAILGRRSTEDIIHCIASPKMTLSEATDVIYHTLRILEIFKPSLPYAYTRDIMGVATEVYRSRVKSCEDDKEKEVLEDQWLTAHAVCSVAACNIAFEDCKEEDEYDLEAAWQLIGLCTWVVNFTEKLMKAAVLCNNSGISPQRVPGEFLPRVVPYLLHFTHPFPLQNLIVALKHVKAVRTYLGSRPAGGENAQMAKLVLVDTVDSSGINFGALVVLLEEVLPTVKALDPQICQRALAVCQPIAAMQPLLMKLVNQLSDSERILNKTTLFIKPLDIVDGIARLSIDPRNANGNDVITKNLLPGQGAKDECLRCGGKTAGSRNVTKVVGPASCWMMWQRMWQLRCICGGPWWTVH